MMLLHLAIQLRSSPFNDLICEVSWCNGRQIPQFAKRGWMMSKRFSRKAMRSFAVACLTLMVVCLGGAKLANGAFFSGTQALFVTGSPGIFSQPCQLNVATNVFSCLPAFSGSYGFNYSFPFNAFYVFYLYDFAQARFVDAVVVRD